MPAVHHWFGYRYSPCRNSRDAALRVALNRIADTHPQYHDMANQVAFGTALDVDGHSRVGQHINYMCTQDGTVLIDLTYDVLLTESIKLSEEEAALNK